MSCCVQIQSVLISLVIFFVGFASTTVNAKLNSSGQLLLDDEADNKDEFFEKQVRPLLVKRCYQCHSGTKTSGGLNLDHADGWKKGGDSGPAIVPGKPAQSLIIDAVNYRDLEMPPDDAGGRLPKEEIEILEKWIQNGAFDPRKQAKKLGGMNAEQAKHWWSFQPLPKVTDQPTPETIDKFLESKLGEQGIKPSSPADRRTLIRRMTYGLTGLPPTADEVEAFTRDKSKGAVSKLIERLLDSKQYGIHWGRHWLDVVRYADTAGENTDRPLPHAWRYRNWVMNSFNSDQPYDQFVREQLAGDLLASNKELGQKETDQIIATGYLAIARRFGHDIDKDIHLMYEDVIDNLGKNFLGLTLGCARCHDHKYDPLTAEDYYALYGIFDNTTFSFPGCEPKGQPRDLIPLIPQSQVDSINRKFELAKREFKAKDTSQKQIGQEIKRLAAKSYRVLSKSLVGEGKSESLESHSAGKLDRISIKKGEVLQLTILPNGNYGADTTRIQWRINQLDGKKTTWNIEELIPRYKTSGPVFEHHGATWCLLDTTDGPVFLGEKQTRVAGNDSLNGWSYGSNPSSVVNDSEKPVSVWTTLPASALFVHPGIGRNVSIAWICPEDGIYEVKGVVTDAHPAGLDGVTFQFEHFRDQVIGEKLLRLAKLTAVREPTPPTFPVAYAVREKAGVPRDAIVQLKGDPEQLGPKVSRRWLQVFGGQPFNKTTNSGRLELAERVIDHPLFARVIVNRVWQWHFGKGLVSTPNDFGSRGNRPSHPELLDWLAAHFKASGYRLKPLHRLILSTKAYQRSSAANTQPTKRKAFKFDCFSTRRLSAEEIRDSLLWISGDLDLGFATQHPFPPESSWKFTQHDPFNAVYPSRYRSAFLMVQRQRRHPYLALFDGADPNSSTPAREATTVPSQALYFLNDPFFHEQATKISAWVCKEKKFDDRVQQAFSRIFQRSPSSTEKTIAQEFIENYSGKDDEKWAAFVRVLLSSNEFLYID